MRQRRPRLTRASALILMLLAMLPCAGVRAQGFRSGVSTALPPPISSLELARFASMMNLTAEQLRAWSESHERYKAEWKALGDDGGGGAIAAFIEARKAVEGTPFRAQPPKAAIDKWMNAHQTVFAAIATLDARLFDELVPILAEQQQPLLQRAKLSRERTRLAGDELVAEWLNPNTKTDLCEVFATVEAKAGDGLSADDKAALWASLDDYQAQWVGKLRGLQSSARGMYRDWRTLLDERGVAVDAADVVNRETLDMQVFQQISKSWYEVNLKVKPRLNELTTFNRSRAKAIAASLPPQAADRFMRGFFDIAYPDSPADRLKSMERKIFQSMGTKGLTVDERSALQALMAQCRAAVRSISERAADLADQQLELQRPNSTMQNLELDKARMDMFASAEQTQDQLEESLKDVLGPERAKGHAKAGRESTMRDMIRKSGVSDAAEVERLMAELRESGSVRIGQRGGYDGPIPDVIAPDDIEAIIKTQALPPDDESILRELYGQYFRQYRKRFDGHADTMNAFALGGWSMRDDGQGGKKMGMASPEDVEKAKAAEVSAIAALRQLDAAFFDDAQAAVAPDAEALWRARLARDWATLARGSRRGNEELRTFEASVPLIVIVNGLPLSKEETTAADANFRARAAEFRAAATAQFEANRTAWYARQLAFGLAEGPTPAAKDVVDAQEQKAITLEKASGERRLALAALIRAMLGELAAALPAHAQALQDGYERTAFPHVFEDRTSPGDALAKALALEDLADPQRAEIEAAAAKYRPAYRDVCARMIEVNREWDKERPYSRMKIPEQDEAKLKWDRLLFERDELNAGVNATLLRILTPEQRAKVGLAVGETK